MPPASAYSLMVAGHRAGKTAFLRLLLDTATVADSASVDQRNALASWLQLSSAPTARIRSAALDIAFDSPHEPPITLSVVDTPTLDTRDKKRADAVLHDILLFLESRFQDSLDHDHKGRQTDPHVHLCLYFLDPDVVVPPRPRINPADFDNVLLDPPHLARPTLAPAEVDAIRLLSTRCNVLPVVARADTITTDRLAAIKLAVRRDLAASGIGFGIFDLDQPPDPNSASAASSSSSPTSPGAPQMLRLPYAVVSPDCYSHSDGVPRASPSRGGLVLGRFIRAYRWGALDVLDHTHCDFMPLRHAIFQHMDALQKYTRDYLFNKFVDERSPPSARSRPTSAVAAANTPNYAPPVPGPPPPLPLSQQQQQQPQPPPPSQPPSAIPAQPHPVHTLDALYTSSAPRHQIPVGDPRACSPLSDPAQVLAQAASSSSKSSRQRAKKITIACNFCRSRKLKCDGQRPACHQCQKRSHACDYQAPAKRRGARSSRRATASDSEDGAGSADEGSLEPSLSPEVKPEPLRERERLPPPFTDVAQQQQQQQLVLPPLPKSEPIMPTMLERRAVVVDPHAHSHPHAPRPFLPPLSRPPEHASAPPVLPPIHEPEPVHATPAPPKTPSPSVQTNGRKRASTSASKANGGPPNGGGTPAPPGPQAGAGNGNGSSSNRAASHYGPKVVACNHCRARKTKCDGLHPTCSSCARRSLECTYVNDVNNPARRRNNQAQVQAQAATTSSNTPSEPSSGTPSARENEPPEPVSSSGLKRDMPDGIDRDGGAKRLRTSGGGGDDGPRMVFGASS